eukprot:8474480-Karenia_brevis.AAC.1
MMGKKGVEFVPKEECDQDAAASGQRQVVDGPQIEEINTDDEEEWPKEADKALRGVCNKFTTILHKFIKAKRRLEK